MRGRSPARRRSPPFPRLRAPRAGAPRTWRSCSARSACATSWSITRVMSTGGWGRTAKSPRRSYWRRISTRSSGPRWTSRWSGAASGSRARAFRTTRAASPRWSRWRRRWSRLGGGTGLNSIPQEAWLDLDLRSEDPRALAQLDVTVRAALERAADDENRRRTTGSPTLRVDIQLLGDRPSGMTPRAHPLVQAAVAANRALGRDAELASASTDANVPIALGIPAIALGAGGKAGDAHLATEWYENV